MKVVITGTSMGIGRQTAIKFLENGHEVHGLDVEMSSIEHSNYIHHQVDVRWRDDLPDIEDVDILINNAGIQLSLFEGEVFEVNVSGVMNCTEKYGLQSNIKSILNQASVSSHNGAEFPEYVASKGAVLSYTKWVAKQVGQYGATCNSLSFGGVYTTLNESIMEDQNPDDWKKIMDMTPLKKWVTVQEAANWIYFVTVVNQSMSGQDIIIDNLEMLNHTFVWH